MKKFIITAPGKFHVNSIIKLIKEKNSSSKIIIISSSPNFLEENINGLKFIFIPMFFQLIFRKVFKLHQPGFLKYLDYVIFDFLASFFVTNDVILIGFAGVSLFSGKKAIKNNGHYYLDRACPFFNFQYDLISKEYLKNGLPIPYIPKILKNRLLKEYIYSTLIIVPSEYSKNSYPSFFTNKIVKQKILINPFSNTRSEKPFIKQNNIFYIGFIGGDFIRKGVSYIINAFEEIFKNHTDIILVIKMNPIEFKKTKKIIDFVDKYSENIIFINYLNNISSFYENIDYLILPSVDEGFGMVVLESLSCFKPVIVSSNVGAGDYLVNSNFSYIFKVGDNNEFIFYIEKAYNNYKCSSFYEINNDCKILYNNFMNSSSNLLKHL